MSEVVAATSAATAGTAVDGTAAAEERFRTGLADGVSDWLGTNPEPKAAPDVEHGADPSSVVDEVFRHARLLGITRLADITGLDTIGIPVATACRPNARSLSVSQGKGATAEGARASAMMEAAETAHGERPRLPLRLAPVAELAAAEERHIDPSDLPRRFAARWPIDRPTLWATGISLVDGGAVLVPYDAVHLDLTGPDAATSYLPTTSNGLASGNSLAEAVVHALCELVERDAASAWELLPADEQAATRMDPSTVSDPVAASLIDRYAAADVALALYDLTSPIGPPVLLAQIADRTPNPFRPVAPAAGLGCHLHPAAALRRALTEAAQTRLVDIAGARDDLIGSRYPRVGDGGTWAEGLAPLGGDARPFPAGNGDATTTVAGDLANLVGRLACAGLEPVAVDLSDDRINIPVVRVVVAGLAGLPAMMTGPVEPQGGPNRNAATPDGEDGTARR